MNLCADITMLGISAHRRFNTEPFRACILSSFLLALSSVSISCVASETILFDRAASSTTRTPIGHGTDDGDDSVVPHVGCPGLREDNIPPPPKYVGADSYAENCASMDASGYSPAHTDLINLSLQAAMIMTANFSGRKNRTAWAVI